MRIILTIIVTFLLLLLFASYNVNVQAEAMETGIAQLPLSEIYAKEVKTYAGIVTAYNSLPEQTDDTPFITAAGTKTREGVVANNCLPFGTKVEIARKQYTVEDRMARRYGCEHFDIWFADYGDAVEWGRQELSVSVIE